MSSNPLRFAVEASLRVDPCIVVIFGATGDLTHRKLVPALYALGVDNLLPERFSLIGFARRPLNDESFRRSLRDSAANYVRQRPLDDSRWQDFAQRISYVCSSLDQLDGYERLAELLSKIEADAGRPCNRIFYLATAPEYFEITCRMLCQAGLLETQDFSGGRRFARVVVEKPFGYDLESAQRLNRSLLSCMKEEQIYRIDHYLGKETVQNLLVFRFANGIFEPIWNHKYISHVEISVCESVGVGSRAGYFDATGILRDIVQNHALQLLCLVALEPPVTFEADSVRDEKVKVLRSVRRIAAVDVAKKALRARYLAGFIEGQPVPGYLAEPGVSEKSRTDTYAALELLVDNWRWAGVPFFIRAGKRLAKRVTSISVHFRRAPHQLFGREDVRELAPNVLSFQIQPDEGINFRISSKPPGPHVRVQTVNMDFSYGTSFGVEPPEAYERLLLDAMRGDATLFTRSDEIEEAWEIVDPVLRAWRDPTGIAGPVYGYEAGTWGPAEADELIRRATDGDGWRRL